MKNLQAIGSEDIGYTYDLGGRLQTIKSPAGEITSLHYDAEGRLNKKQLPNGLDEIYAYQNNDWVTSVEIRNRATQAAVDLQTYSYFDTGLVHQHARGLSPNVVTTTYGYDELGQLLAETRSGVTTSYTYDGNGNRLTKQVGSAAPEVYLYDLGDKLEQVSVNGTPVRTYGYDDEGRRISKTAGGQTTTYAWNADNRLTGIDLPTGNDPAYTYNGAGARVGRTAGATSNVFKRSGASATASVLQDGEASYVPGLSERRAGVTTFQHSNLKNVSAQSQTGTTLSASRTYDAFGSVESGTCTFVGPFGYGGGFGYQSTDGGLMLLGHRYYDPEDGRFISRDPIKDGRNWYSYCENNPVSHADPKGLSRITFLYRLIKKETGDLVKYGITFNPKKRYSKKVLREKGYGIDPFAGYPGPDGRSHSRHALDDERHMVETDPGPENREPWAGKKRDGGWFVVAAIIREIVEAFDPTPVGLAIEGGKALGRAVEPWAEENNAGDWNHGGTASYNQCLKEAFDDEA